MDASCSKDVRRVNLAKVLLKMMNQFIQKYYQKQTVILIIQMNIMKMIFLEIYQLQWTLRIKIMMINGFK